MPADLLAALLQQESGFNPNARSPAGAEGIAQFMPGTARGMGIDPFNPQSAIPGAARYLSNALRTNHGSVSLALASYNAGQGAVNQYHGVPPYSETQNYVRSVQAGRSRFPGLASGGAAGATPPSSTSLPTGTGAQPTAALGMPDLQTVENPAYHRIAGIQDLLTQNAQNAHIPTLNLPLPPQTVTQPASQPSSDVNIRITNPSAPAHAALAAGPQAAHVVNLARQYLGTPYQWGGATPKGFDCSGLAKFIYARVGVNLPRTSEEQFNAGRAVNIQQLQPGDLVFFKGTHGAANDVSHEGIYIGGGRFIHAPHTGDVVKISNLSDSYYQQHFAGARRVA